MSLATRLRSGAEWVSCAMFAAVFLIFNVKIASRYLGEGEPAWADEVSVILFIWIVFWASALVTRDRDQIVFDLAYRPLPACAKRIAAILRHGLIGGIFLYSAYGSIDYLVFLWRERTPVLSLRLDWVYSCFGLFVVAVTVRSVAALAGLLGPDWRSRT